MFRDQLNRSEIMINVLPGYCVEWCRALGDGTGSMALLRRATLADPSLPRFVVSLRRGEAVERLPANSIHEAAKITYAMNQTALAA